MDYVKEYHQKKGYFHDPDDFNKWYDREISPRINELLDIIALHFCTLDVEGQSCICVDIAQELDELDYQIAQPKYIFLDEVPF